MNNPKIEISLATDSRMSKVVLNGVNISHLVRRVDITQTAGSIPQIKLHIFDVSFAAKINDEAHVELVVSREDVDEISSSR